MQNGLTCPKYRPFVGKIRFAFEPSQQVSMTRLNAWEFPKNEHTHRKLKTDCCLFRPLTSIQFIYYHFLFVFFFSLSKNGLWNNAKECVKYTTDRYMEQIRLCASDVRVWHTLVGMSECIGCFSHTFWLFWDVNVVQIITNPCHIHLIFYSKTSVMVELSMYNCTCSKLKRIAFRIFIRQSR